MKKTAQNNNIFSAYINDSCEKDRLTKEEERNLIQSFQGTGHQPSVDRLLADQCANILYLAKKYKTSNLSLDELFNEGVVGFMVSLKSFDLQKNIRLSTYCIYYIKQHILDFVEKNTHQVKLISNARVKKVRRSMKTVDEELSFTDQVKTIAKKTGLKQEAVHKAMERFQVGFVAMDQLDPNGFELVDDFSNSKNIENSIDESLKKQWLQQNLDFLNEREREAITQRYLESTGVKTFREIAEPMGVSAQYIESVCKTAIQKLSKKAGIQGFALEAINA